MKESRVVIYISPLPSPFLSLEIQEKYCKIKAKMNKYENITVYKDDNCDNEKIEFEKMIKEVNFYDALIIYSLGNLGKSFTEINSNVEKLFKNNNTKLICFAEPMNFKSIGEYFSNKT